MNSFKLEERKIFHLKEINVKSLYNKKQKKIFNMI